MRTKDYAIKTIREDLERELSRQKAFCEAWKAVTRNYKKDGTPFANMSKNFSGCKLQHISYLPYAYEKEFVVSTCAPLCGYISDGVKTYDNIHAEDYPAERVQDWGFSGVFVELTADEIWDEIQKRIAYYQDCIEKSEKALAELETTYESVASAVEKAVSTIDKDSPLRYAITCYIAENIRFL